MNDLVQSDMFQFLAIMVAVVGGTVTVVWKVATFSSKIISTQEQHTKEIKELQSSRLADERRIAKLEYSKL